MTSARCCQITFKYDVGTKGICNRGNLMPYQTLSDLPDAVQALGDKKARQWMHIFNGAYDRCLTSDGKDCEASANKQAWGVVNQDEFLKIVIENVKVFSESVLPNGNFKITGEAIHPVRTHHPFEWGTLRAYIEPYLEKAAPSLVGKPFSIDHERDLPKENKITKAFWDSAKSAVMFEGEITPAVHAMFINGELIDKVSVGVDWMRPCGGILVGQDGELIAYNFDFYELSFISRGGEAGDPTTTLQIWETVLQESKSLQEKCETRMEEKDIKKIVDDAINEAIKKLPPTTKPEDITKMIHEALDTKANDTALNTFKESLKAYPDSEIADVTKALTENKPLADMQKMLENAWTTDYINALPDESFARIVKEDNGKIVRLHAHHDKDGKVVKERTVSALNAVATELKEKATDIPLKAMYDHLVEHCKAEGLESAIAGITKDTIIVDLRKELNAARDKVAIAEAKVDTTDKRRKTELQGIAEMLAKITPPQEVKLSHPQHSGFNFLTESIKRVKYQVEGMI